MKKDRKTSGPTVTDEEALIRALESMPRLQLHTAEAPRKPAARWLTTGPEAHLPDADRAIRRSRLH